MLKIMENLPQTINQAVAKLLKELPIKQKTEFANITEENLINLHFSYGTYVRNKFCIWENEKLMESCNAISGENNLDEDAASALIIKRLWKRLQIIKKLRVVK